jgi:alkyl hydroperoxide reductase subunit AhpC
LKTLLTPQENRRVQILTVSTDTHAESKQFGKKLKAFPGNFDFPMLEDRDHKVIDRYGILNPEGKGWPHPATYLIDKAGVVRWRFITTNYTKRPTNEQILEALRTVS